MANKDNRSIEEQENVVAILQTRYDKASIRVAALRSAMDKVNGVRQHRDWSEAFDRWSKASYKQARAKTELEGAKQRLEKIKRRKTPMVHYEAPAPLSVEAQKAYNFAKNISTISEEMLAEGLGITVRKVRAIRAELSYGRSIADIVKYFKTNQESKS